MKLPTPLIFFALFCLFSSSIHAQHEAEENVRVSVDSLKKLFRTGQYPAVISQGKQAAYDCLQSNDCPRTEAALAFTWTANALTRLSQQDSCFYYAQQALALLHKDSLDHQWALANVYTTLGHYYGHREEFNKAIDIFKQKLKLQFDPDSKRYKQNISASYANLAVLYHLSGNIQEALGYMLESNKLGIELYGKDDPKLGVAFNNTANMYMTLREYDKAITYFHRSIELIANNWGANHPYLATTYDNLSSIYKRLEDYERALEYTLKAEEILLKTTGEQHPNYAKTILSKGRIYGEMKEYDQAIKYIEAATAVRYKYLNPKHPLIGNDYIYLSEFYGLKGDYEKARECLDKAEAILGYKKAEQGDFKDVDRLTYFINYCNKKRAYYKGLSTVHPNTPYRDSILQLLDQQLALFDYVERKANLKDDRLLKIEEAFPVFEAAIAYRFQTGDQAKLQEAFTVSEKSKSRLLSQNFKALRAARFYNIPDSTIKKEEAIQKKIAKYELKQFKEKFSSPNPNDSLLATLESKLLEFNLEKETFEEHIKMRYPDYYQLKHSSDVSDISAIRSSLSPNESFLEYFVGDSSIYIFVIGKDIFEARKIKKDFPLEQWVSELRESTSAFWRLGGQSDSLYQANADIFTEKAFLLYQKLVAPVQSFLTERFVIIPDGALHFLPFESLLTERPENSTAFRTHAYLLRAHQISYDYSVNLRVEPLRKKILKADKNLLAFAPSFAPLSETKPKHEAMRGGLYQLHHNTSEGKAITSIIPGELILEQEANKIHFLQMANNYKILHLATHGKANDQEGVYSFLAFTNLNDSEEDNDLLYARELYNTSINADLVVLSACETGIGELKRGEGMISLARGFTYAGAQSVLTSLWNINDGQTAKLFTYFYQNIKKGMPKDEALRQAKLSYIEEGGLADPYFWSPFVITGNMSPIPLSTFSSTLLWGITALGLLILVGAFFYKRKTITP